MNVLDLFSGIGGFSLGLERAGMRTVAFCEQDEWCRKLLRHHWPTVPCYDDICTLTADRLAADGIFPRILAGGFPCQDVSLAGDGAGLAGQRSGLWREYARLIRELRPDYAIVENVSALLHRGLGEVLGDLAEIGYDAEWHCIPAHYVGLPHNRDRIWIVAYPNGDGSQRLSPPRIPRRGWEERAEQLEGLHAMERRLAIPSGKGGGITDGVPCRLDRLHALGNAVVPQIPEIIGRAIMEAERERRTAA